jgi:hypothetical protein
MRRKSGCFLLDPGVAAPSKIIWEFKIFALYLIVDIPRSIIVWWLGGSTANFAYRVAWVVTELAYLVLQVLVVVEFYRLLYRAYPGIQAFARALLVVAVAVAWAVTFGTLQLDIGRVEWGAPDMQRLFVAKRLVSSLGPSDVYDYDVLPARPFREEHPMARLAPDGAIRCCCWRFFWHQLRSCQPVGGCGLPDGPARLLCFVVTRVSIAAHNRILAEPRGEVSHRALESRLLGSRPMADR